jgi:hypothetical protein
MTPEEIVALIGNHLPDYPDYQQYKDQQVEEIYKLVKEFEDIAKEWKKGYQDLLIKHRVEVGNLKATIEDLEDQLSNLTSIT